MSFLAFVREKRATILIGTGSVTAFVWFLFMLNYRLFEIRPFGAETSWSMWGTILLFAPLAFVLLVLVYYFGSENSLLRGTGVHFAYELSRWLYVAFKNGMIVFWLVTLMTGAPRVKYYQVRVVEGSGFDNLSYYERRTIFNVFQNGSEIVDTTSDYSEDSGIWFVPMSSDGADSNQSDSDSDSSSKSKGGGDGLAELALMLLAILAVLASLAFYVSIVVMSFYYANFWLVAILCIAIGMITLGFIDIHDGPRI